MVFGITAKSATMRKSKKIVSLLSAVAVALSAVSLTATAAENSEKTVEQMLS